VPSPKPPTPQPLPAPPAVQAVIVRDSSATASALGGFVNVRRLEIAVQLPGGPLSATFPFDIATRAGIDAVALVAHFEKDGVPHVYLRSCPRPSLMLFDGRGGPRNGNLWEIPAGIIDPGETAREAGARELYEELGFLVDEGALVPLGGLTYPVPGFIAERHQYFHIAVDPAERETPTEDGSPLEANALVVTCSLADALAHCRSGSICDSKTELALRRLVEALS
jgi:8-oxo-dGTP pyrophosphatase MutT (NUDIX family)